MYIMPTSTASDATRESALSDFSHSLLDFLTRNPRYTYIVINDLPKIENLKRLFPELYRTTPVLVAATTRS